MNAPTMLTIYGDAASGNCQKVRFVADHLRLPYTWVPIDTARGDSRTPAYLAKFPQGQVPAIEIGEKQSDSAGSPTTSNMPAGRTQGNAAS